MNQFLVSDVTFFCAKLLVVIGIFGLLQHLVAIRCRAMICGWAQQAGWQVVKTHRRFFRVGPFRFNPGLPVYFVTLQNGLGKQRHAYVRCGHELISVLSDEMAVEWIGPGPKMAKD